MKDPGPRGQMTERRAKRSASEDGRTAPQRQPLLAFAGYAFADGTLAFASNFWRENFVGDRVAGALEGAPHVPAGDGAVGAPLFAEGEGFLRLGHVLFAVGYRPAFLDAQVVDGEHVWATQIEDQQHFHGPGADTADRYETFKELFV